MGKLWESIVRPMMFGLDPERAHELGVAAMRLGGTSLFGSQKHEYPGFGEIKRFGIKFDNPVGIAAGFDKNAIVVGQLARLGFGFVEVGTVTNKPQPGNPKPRMFRLPADQALINRLGFNNKGAAAAATRLSAIDRKCVVGVNIGKNKDVPNEEAS